MIESVIGYHGTKDLKGIIREQAVLPRFYLEGGKENWEVKKREYDAICEKVAAYVRTEGRPRLERHFPKIVRDSRLFENDEILTDTLNHLTESPISQEEWERYSELRKGLIICVAKTLWNGAYAYEGASKGEKVGGILKLEFPKNLLVQTSQNWAHMEFMGRLDLRYLIKVIAGQDNEEGIRRALEGSVFGNIPLHITSEDDCYARDL